MNLAVYLIGCAMFGLLLPHIVQSWRIDFITCAAMAMFAFVWHWVVIKLDDYGKREP